MWLSNILHFSNWLVKYLSYKSPNHTHANDNITTNSRLWEITRQILRRQTEVGICPKTHIPKWSCKSQSCVRLMIRQGDRNLNLKLNAFESTLGYFNSYVIRIKLCYFKYNLLYLFTYFLRLRIS